MESWMMQLGVGGIFAIVVLREVFNFLKSKNGKDKCGGDVSREEFESHKKDVQYESTCKQIVKRMDGRFDNLDNQCVEIKSMIEGLES